MNLIVDVGNTLVKFAVFEEDCLIWKKAFKLSQFRKEYKLIKKQFPTLKYSIVSSVGSLEDKDVELLKGDLKVLELDWQTKVPFENKYKTPRTLGVDRIALVCASVSEFPDINALIIDAGSCITYDFVTSENEYFGGAISPGLRLRYKTLNNFTANLPLLDTKSPENIIGNTTATSIHSGVVIGVVKEIEGVINEYVEKYPDLTVILTGGDAKFLSNQLKNSIFANSNFLLEGLNFILEFNSK